MAVVLGDMRVTSVMVLTRANHVFRSSRDAGAVVSTTSWSSSEYDYSVLLLELHIVGVQVTVSGVQCGVPITSK